MPSPASVDKLASVFEATGEPERVRVNVADTLLILGKDPAVNGRCVAAMLTAADRSGDNQNVRLRALDVIGKLADLMVAALQRKSFDVVRGIAERTTEDLKVRVVSLEALVHLAKPGMTVPSDEAIDVLAGLVSDAAVPEDLRLFATDAIRKLV